MEENPDNTMDDCVIIVEENEAESRQSQNEKPGEGSSKNLLDTCAVCLQSLQSRDPRLLPCLHSFCSKCVPLPARYVALAVGKPTAPGGANSAAEANKKQVGVIRCPVCKQECAEKYVMENYFVKDTAEVPSSTVEKSSQVCTSCEDKTEATGFCVECVEWLCKTCVEAHQRVKFTKDHAIRQKEEVSPAVCLPNQRPVFCPIHKQEQLKLFCETCDRLTCRDCQLLEHKEHRYQFLEDAFKNQKGYIEALTAKLLEKNTQIDCVKEQLKKRLIEIEENHKKVEQEIKLAILSLIVEVNRRGKGLMNQLQALAKDRRTKLVQQEKEILNFSKHVEHVLNFAKSAVCNSSSTALLYSKRLIMFQLHYLLRAKCDPSLITNSTIHFHCDPTFWAKNVVNLGSLVVDNNPLNQQNSLHTSASTSHSGLNQGEPALPLHPQSFLLSNLPPDVNLSQLQQQIDRLAQRNSMALKLHAVPPNPQGVHSQSPVGASQTHLLQRPPAGYHCQQVPAESFQGLGPPSQSVIHRTMVTPPQPPRLINLQNLRREVSSSSSQAQLTKNWENVPKVRTESTAHNLPSPEEINHLTQQAFHQLGSAGSLVLDDCLVKDGKKENSHSKASVTNPSPGPSTPSSSIKVAQSANMPTSSAHTSTEDNKGCSLTSSLKTAGKEPQSKRPLVRLESIRIKPELGGVKKEYDFPVIVVKEEDDEKKSTDKAASSKCTNIPDSTREQDTSDEELCYWVPRGRQEQKETGEGGQEDDPNEDWCAVCQNGGELLCCEKCPKVFHLSCHVPALLTFPSGEWICTFCRSITFPEVVYDCLNSQQNSEKRKSGGLPGLPPTDLRKCERLLLFLYCHELSVDFQEPVPPSIVPDYYKIIKRPMDLSLVRRKLQRRNTHHYQKPEDFVSDIRLIFKNCAEFNEPDSEVALAGKVLDDFFHEKLKLLYPDKKFPLPESTKPAREHTTFSDDSDDDDDDDDFIQPKKKHWKTEERLKKTLLM
ncbi:transcription intermediary factor 1-alpha isoform X2 [Polypterus senegalus]|uniref:transcription intermediary factor 1-alpha isoform X2 n=1 Tax=Polypterus senegalus TaxID=55291 RepID=UPI001965CBB3|nr:transcription intermediary factor 1-alpha isoform X2 [Polypterus senegalus]